MNIEDKDLEKMLEQMQVLMSGSPEERDAMLAQIILDDARKTAGTLLGELEACETDAEKIDAIAKVLLKTANTAHVGFASMAINNFRQSGMPAVTLTVIEHTIEHHEGAITILEPSLKEDHIKNKATRKRRMEQLKASVYGEPEEEEEENDESEEGVHPNDEDFEGFNWFGNRSTGSDD